MTEKPDAYYGEVAENYDASRSGKPKWQAELRAVDKFLRHGPVLDVPLGTGRFVPIYRAKGLEFTGVDISDDMLAIARRKFPGIDAHKGSIFDLPTSWPFNVGFGTVVCVRLLEWMPVQRAAGVIARLSQIAPNLILTINHGEEGMPEAYTYDFGKFLAAIDGLMIAGRQVTANVKGITSEMFALRPATWDDVVLQFSYDYPEDAEANIQRLADKFCGFFDMRPVKVARETVTVRAEYWTGDKIGNTVAALAAHRFISNEPPRRDDLPLTVLERGGVRLMIDGRKRANQWMNKPGPHPVLVLRHG